MLLDYLLSRLEIHIMLWNQSTGHEGVFFHRLNLFPAAADVVPWYVIALLSLVCTAIVILLSYTNSSQSIGIVSLANWLKPAAINGPLYTKLIMMGNQRRVTLTILAIVKTGLSLYKQTWALYMASM